MNKQTLLELPVKTLPASNRFKEAMARHDIKTLDEIVNIPVTEMVNLKWFTEDILQDLSRLLFNAENQ